MEAFKECERCKGTLTPRHDFSYNIDYYCCVNCGNVVFVQDGLGIQRLHLPPLERKYELTCTICKGQFKSLSPNRKRCDSCR